jgi:4-aminobutyrate aminotransferase-like enzyme
LEILEREDLTERARQMGQRLLTGLQTLMEFSCVGDVRGLGLMCAVEFVTDRETRAPAGIGDKVRGACLTDGLLTRTKGDILMLAPPLIISETEVDKIVEIVRKAISSVHS